jgi:hypothetical protein
MTLRIMRLPLEMPQIVGDPAGQIGLHHLRRDADRGCHADFARAPVALQHQSVEAQEDRAVVIVGIEMIA